MIYERKPNRLKGYDYSKDNLYFVTSCVHDRICCFGEIVWTDLGEINVVGTGRDLSLRQMILNEYGKIAERQWYWLAEQYPYVVLHAFVVMPNHIHGIIEIDHSRIVWTGRDLSIHNPEKIKSLPELMGAYKTTVSKQIHLLECNCGRGRSRPVPTTINFSWQRSYYEHIIRDEQAFVRISNYILNNPIKWKEDKFFY